MGGCERRKVIGSPCLRRSRQGLLEAFSSAYPDASKGGGPLRAPARVPGCSVDMRCGFVEFDEHLVGFWRGHQKKVDASAIGARPRCRIDGTQAEAFAENGGSAVDVAAAQLNLLDPSPNFCKYRAIAPFPSESRLVRTSSESPPGR